MKIRKWRPWWMRSRRDLFTMIAICAGTGVFASVWELVIIHLSR